MTTTLNTSPTLISTPPSATPTHSSSSDSGAIAGGVVGGVGAVAVAGLAVFFWLRRKRSQAPSVVFDTPEPLMSEVWSSEGGTYVPSSMHGTPPTSMKLYVRVSTPRLDACMFSTTSLCTGPERPNHIPRVPKCRSGAHRSACCIVQRKHSVQRANFRSTGISRLAHCLILSLYFCRTSPGSGRIASIFFLPFACVFSSEVFCRQLEPTLESG